MTSYLIRRFGIGLVTLLLITFLVYGLIRAMPGTPVTGDQANLDPSKQLSPEAIEKLNRLYGLDKPWYEAYFSWMKNVLHLDLGTSFSRNNKDVFHLIVERIPATLILSASSLVLTYLLSIPLGLWETAKSTSLSER